MSTRTVTVSELASILLQSKGSRFVGLTAETTPRANKKGREDGQPNPFGRIVKRSRVRGIIGFKYENSVNNQREREDHPEAGEFVAEARSWGHRVDGTPVVLHKGKKNGEFRAYLEVKVDGASGTTYVADGREVDRQDVAQYLPKSKGSERQDVDAPVILRDYALESIREIRIGGETLTVVDG